MYIIFRINLSGIWKSAFRFRVLVMDLLILEQEKAILKT